MSIINQLSLSLKEEYLESQDKRREESGKGIIHATDIITPCEEKIALVLSGVKPPEGELTDYGARIHGSILHRAIEDVIKRRMNTVLIEKEYKVKYRDAVIVAHPDLLAEMRGALYDIKTVNPFVFNRILKQNRPSLMNTLQMNIYAYILSKNGINVDRAYIEYISKSKITIRSKGSPPMEIKDFDMMEVGVDLNFSYVRVLFKNLDDVLRKMESGEPLLGVKDTVEKWKKLFEEHGLDSRIIDEEEYPKWMCDYCDYKDICPIMQAQKEGEKEEGGVNLEIG